MLHFVFPLPMQDYKVSIFNIHHLSSKRLGPELSCAHAHVVAKGYIPKHGIALSIFFFFHFVGSKEPLRVRRATNAPRTTQPGLNETQTRFSAPDSLSPSKMDAEFIFYLADATVHSNETRCTTIQAPGTTTKKLGEEKPSAVPAVTLASGKRTGSHSSILRQTRLQGPS